MTPYPEPGRVTIELRQPGRPSRIDDDQLDPGPTALALERELQQQLFASDDAREGLNAYVEKRKPDFSGS